MTGYAIRVDGLGKEYVIGGRESGYRTFREQISDAIAAPLRHLRAIGRESPPERRFWALNDVSFDVKPGEVVGIIGRNGAGKSTLLKILSRITAPTKGRIVIRGRVSSLLEVGTGFHPELTGRENIYLNGAILGMSRAEITQKFDEIVDFSGVEKFLDTPVKRYSSGMYLRLAFSVAAHLEPEILIVDEVLAVGDAEFQRKCLGKMSEVARGGRTVLFVSHNMSAIRALCGRAIAMTAGRIQSDGEAEKTITDYLFAGDSTLDSRTEWTWPKDDAPGNGDIRLRKVRLHGEKSSQATFRPDEDIAVVIEYEQTKWLRGMRFKLTLLTSNGETVFATSDYGTRRTEGYPAGRYQTRCLIPGNLLNRKTYIMSIYAGIPNPPQRLMEDTNVGHFIVAGSGDEGSITVADSRAGVVCPTIQWQLTRLEED